MYDVTEKNIYPRAILSDNCISTISFRDAEVHCIFQNGITIVANDNSNREDAGFLQTGNAEIVLEHCKVEDMRCQIKYKFRVFGRILALTLACEPECLKKLFKHHQLEIVDEFYSYCQLFWRCELQPYKKRGLSTEFEIYSSSFSAIRYQWNIRK